VKIRKGNVDGYSHWARLKGLEAQMSRESGEPRVVSNGGSTSLEISTLTAFFNDLV